MPPKKKAKTEALNDSASWQYIDDDNNWVLFDADDAAEIELNFRKHQTTFTTENLTFNRGFNTKYKFDFSSMTQSNEETGRQRFICRIAPKSEFQWEWEDDMKLMVPYKEEDSAEIEKLFRTCGGKPISTKDLSWNEGFDSAYEFSFSNGELVTGMQRNVESGTQRTLRRIQKKAPWDVKGFGITAEVLPPKSKFTATKGGAPTYWEDVPTIDKAIMGSFDSFAVSLSSNEGKSIISTFATSLPSAKVQQITRIQNVVLWSFYALNRDNIEQRNAGDPNEAYVFYGERSKSNVNTICKYGFDTRVADNGSFGQGIYFGTSPQYCDVGRCLVNTDGSKELLVCRAAIGSSTLGSTGIRRPPPKDPAKPTMDLFDSCADSSDPKKVSVRVIFSNSQAYPEYLVRYK